MTKSVIPQAFANILILVAFFLRKIREHHGLKKMMVDVFWTVRCFLFVIPELIILAEGYLLNPITGNNVNVKRIKIRGGYRMTVFEVP